MVSFFSDEYLRSPNNNNIARLLAFGQSREKSSKKWFQTFQFSSIIHVGEGAWTKQGKMGKTETEKKEKNAT